MFLWQHSIYAKQMALQLICSYSFQNGYFMTDIHSSTDVSFMFEVLGQGWQNCFFFLCMEMESKFLITGICIVGCMAMVNSLVAYVFLWCSKYLTCQGCFLKKCFLPVQAHTEYLLLKRANVLSVCLTFCIYMHNEHFLIFLFERCSCACEILLGKSKRGCRTLGTLE